MKRKDFLKNSGLALSGLVISGRYKMGGHHTLSALAEDKLIQAKGFSYRYPLQYEDWANAFLAGNGKKGIMVFGNPLNETVIYNDRGFNLAQTQKRSFSTVNQADLNLIKKYCAEEQFKAADALAVKTADWHDGGEGNRHPGFKMMINIPRDGDISHYSRTCDFNTGEITVAWKDARGHWKRRSFVSRKDDVAVQYLEAPTKGKLNCTIELAVDPGMHFPKGMLFKNDSSGDFLMMKAKYPEGSADAGYEGVVSVEVKGGAKSIKANVVHVSNASSVMMLCRTQKYYHDCEGQWKKGKLQRALKALSFDYATLLQRQKDTHGKIYERVKIDFNAAAEDRAKPNEELLERQADSPVPVNALWERVFYAGRYHYLSSSSELTPPDLLGMWTGDCDAGWGGFYVLDANLNLQIGGGNTGDMPEAMAGYFNIHDDWKADFKENATKLLGCRGLLSCGNTPGTTSGLMAAINTYYPYQYATGEEAWVLYPFWEHYLITGDIDFLKERLFPLLKEMGAFYEDFLKLKDKEGKYIFAGSVSPENQPANIKCSLVNNAVFDLSGAKFLLNTLIEASNLLALEQAPGEGVERWTKILGALPPYLINNDGALKEWAWPGLKDHYDHRHSSQLLPVWPYREISPESDNELYHAARKTLELKDQYNYENAGHGLLHSALIAAGLKNAAAVNHKLLRLTREGFYYDSLSSSHYNNHQVFCTDTCNTVPAVMMEMLISSSPGVLELLPALPGSIKTGSIMGVKGRNRLTIVNLKWDLAKGQINCSLKSDIDQPIMLIQRKGIKRIVSQAPVHSSAYGGIARLVELPKDKSVNLLIEVGGGGNHVNNANTKADHINS